MSINDILNNDNNINTNINNSSNINNINNEKVIISIKSCKNITSKQALLIIPITQYFSNKYILNKLITVLKGESISLRLIDWFVTNYCKKFNVMYNLNEFIDNYVDKDILNKSVSSFDNYILVHNNYKGQLKAYSKKNFDPFCRRNRIRFYYDDNKYFITTVGQLNFFKWAIENNIINYIKKHIKDVENDMNLRCEIVKKISKKKQDTILNANNTNTIINENNIKIKKGNVTRKKRKEISAPSSKSLSIHNLPMTINFD
jgi:hypothetical protein